MTPDQKLIDLKLREEVAPRRFDPRSATPFVNKSVSEETRRAYRKAVADFFQFVGGKHPIEVLPNDVLHWRDHLRAKRQRSATVAFKLKVIVANRQTIYNLLREIAGRRRNQLEKGKGVVAPL